jgi:hypothetical protein
MTQTTEMTIMKNPFFQNSNRNTVEQLTILDFQELSKVHFPMVYRSRCGPFHLVLGCPYGLPGEHDLERRSEVQEEIRGRSQV